SDTWAPVADMPTARAGLATVSGPDGRIYAIGGVNQTGVLSRVEAYDPNSNSWSTVASMPTARSHFAATLGADNRIYAIGGYLGNSGAQAGPTGIVEVYDVYGDTWTTIASMPTVRGFLAGALGQDQRIYAMGGDAGAGTLTVVESLTTAPTPTPIPTVTQSATSTPTPTVTQTATPTPWPHNVVLPSVSKNVRH
ncbi:MAG: hypothetical protein M1358_26030, partial [Chloroflexi bacterium]|nr:hypothetical protein [Chloroflexota bacterium]